MITTQLIETAPGLVFDVSVSGPADGPLVLMLHGFGVSRYLWNAQVEASPGRPPMRRRNSLRP